VAIAVTSAAPSATDVFDLDPEAVRQVVDLNLVSTAASTISRTGVRVTCRTPTPSDTRAAQRNTRDLLVTVTFRRPVSTLQVGAGGGFEVDVR
jgi:hypothetical protein